MPQEASKLRRETKVENKGSAGGDPKLGLIIPCTNITMEAEFNRVLLPKNITVHSTRLKRSTTDLTIDTLTEMERSLEEAMSLLSMIDIDVMVFGPINHTAYCAHIVIRHVCIRCHQYSILCFREFKNWVFRVNSQG